MIKIGQLYRTPDDGLLYSLYRDVHIFDRHYWIGLTPNTPYATITPGTIFLPLQEVKWDGEPLFKILVYGITTHIELQAVLESELVK